MPLTPVIRHGFTFWEAPRCANPPLPELEEPKFRLKNLVSQTGEYRRRARAAEPSISVLPSISPDIVHIQTQVIKAFELTNDEFYGRSRTQNVANARLASMAMCRAYTLCTVEEIAEAHNRHHRVVCHATYRVGELQSSDAAFAAKVARIETTLLKKAA